MSHIKRAKLEKTKGQATVELALIATFLILLLVGVADVARIFGEQLSVVRAAGVGARWAVLPASLQACSGFGSVATVVVEDLSSDVPAANILSIQSVASTDPDAVRVNVTYRHDFLFGIITGVPNTFSTGATMPGAVSTPGVCPTQTGSTPTPVATTTPLPPLPTNTSTPTQPTNTPVANTPTLTSTPTWTNIPNNTPSSTPTSTPTNTPSNTQTFTPTNTPTITPTSTPAARLVITQLIAMKPNGSGKPLDVKVTVTDGTVGQAGVTIAATADGTPISGWAYQGNGVYLLCNAGLFAGTSGDITVDVTASKTGYQDATASTTNSNGHLCP
jgi:hypothetical protein